MLRWLFNFVFSALFCHTLFSSLATLSPSPSLSRAEKIIMSEEKSWFTCTDSEEHKSWALDIKQRKSYILNFIVCMTWLVFFFHFSSLFSFSSSKSFRHNSREFPFHFVVALRDDDWYFLLSFARFPSSNVISIHPVCCLISPHSLLCADTG